MPIPRRERPNQPRGVLVPFAYYKRLNARQRRIYDRSAAITRVALPVPGRLHTRVDGIARALATENRREVEIAVRSFTRGLLEALEVRGVDVRVLAKRPTHNWGELHGLYEPADSTGRARLTVWMRTAQRRDVVAFKTFLRTVLHEIGHHLDYELYELADSYHTEGFYKRESSLFHQLVPDPRRYDRPRSRKPAVLPPKKVASARKSSKRTQPPVQRSLFDDSAR